MNIVEFGYTEEELLEHGLKKLDDALIYFDKAETFLGKNLATMIYIAIRYAESEFDELNEEGVSNAKPNEPA